MEESLNKHALHKYNLELFAENAKFSENSAVDTEKDIKSFQTKLGELSEPLYSFIRKLAYKRDSKENITILRTG